MGRWLLCLLGRDRDSEVCEIINMLLSLRLPTPSLDSFLLPEGHPHLLHCQAQGADKQEDTSEQIASKRWPLRHSSTYDRAGLVWDPSDRKYVTADVLERSASLRQFTTRMRDNVDFHMARLADSSTNVIVDAGQSLDRAPERCDMISAVTPGADFFHLGRGRRVVGCERLAMQGLFPKQYSGLRWLEATASERLVCDLAGNAFPGTVIAGIWTCLLSVLDVSSLFVPVPQDVFECIARLVDSSEVEQTAVQEAAAQEAAPCLVSAEVEKEASLRDPSPSSPPSPSSSSSSNSGGSDDGIGGDAHVSAAEGVAEPVDEDCARAVGKRAAAKPKARAAKSKARAVGKRAAAKVKPSAAPKRKEPTAPPARRKRAVIEPQIRSTQITRGSSTLV